MFSVALVLCYVYMFTLCYPTQFYSFDINLVSCFYNTVSGTALFSFCNILISGIGQIHSFLWMVAAFRPSNNRTATAHTITLGIVIN